MKFKLNYLFSHLDRYEKLAIITGLFFLALLIVVGQFHKIGTFGVETDFYGAYVENAKKIMSGERYYEEDHGPGYFFVLISFYYVFGDFFLAGKFISIISSVLFAFFSFLTLKVLFNTRLAFFTFLLLLILIFPFSILASTDMLFAFLFSFSSYFIFRKGNFSISNLFLAGLVTGYSVMTRLNAIVLPVAIIFSLIILNPPKWPFLKILKAIAIFGIATVITLSPWLILNTIYYGKPFVSDAHKTIAASFVSRETPNNDADFAWTEKKESASEKYGSIFSLIFGNFTAFMIFFFKNIIPYLQMLLFSLIKFPGYLLVAPGILLVISNINKIHLTYFSIALLGFLIYCIVNFDLRFYLYIANFFLFFIVYFLFYENFGKSDQAFKARYKIISKTILIILILFMIKDSFIQIKETITSEPRYLLKIAETIKQGAHNSTIILARKPHLGYLSGMKTELIPDVDTADELLRYAEERKAKYIYYGTVEEQTRPRLKILQKHDQLPAAFELIYSQNVPKVFLYKLATVK